jgi:hypothetical protein
MGGDYTSWALPIKVNFANSSEPQPEVEAYRAWFRE